MHRSSIAAVVHRLRTRDRLAIAARLTIVAVAVLVAVLAGNGGTRLAMVLVVISAVLSIAMVLLRPRRDAAVAGDRATQRGRRGLP